MRSLVKWTIVIVLVISAFFITYMLTLPHYTIVAGLVTGNRMTGINATFRIVRTPVYFRPWFPEPLQFYSVGIPSQRYGGACMVFRASDLVGFNQMAQIKTCTTNGSCMTSEGGGYCDTSTKTCWAKPADAAADAALCERRRKANGDVPWDPEIDHPISNEPVSLTSFGVKPNAEARVVACLNETGSADCATWDGPHRIQRLGTPTPNL